VRPRLEGVGLGGGPVAGGGVVRHRVPRRRGVRPCRRHRGQRGYLALHGFADVAELPSVQKLPSVQGLTRRPLSTSTYAVTTIIPEKVLKVYKVGKMQTGAAFAG